jgi:hypothetical protein
MSEIKLNKKNENKKLHDIKETIMIIKYEYFMQKFKPLFYEQCTVYSFPLKSRKEHNQERWEELSYWPQSPTSNPYMSLSHISTMRRNGLQLTNYQDNFLNDANYFIN